MTTTPTGPPEADQPPPRDHGNDAGHGPRVTRDEARDLTRLQRTTSDSPEGRHIAGVAGGLARHFDIDPIIVRVALVVAIFFGGAGLIVYAAGWLFMPREDTGEAAANVDARSRNLVLYVAAGLAVVSMISDLATGYDHAPWFWIAAVVIVVVLLFRREGREERAERRERVDLRKPGAAGATGAAGAAGRPDQEPVRPGRGSRRRGPILFWFTVVLVGVALGTLGIVDGATGGIPDPAYPATALGVIGAMLVLGSLWGRAGGLILLGLIATVALLGTVGAQEWDGEQVRVSPTSASQLQDSYDLDGGGELVIDLSDIRDLDALDGRSLDVDGDVGRIEVIVPDGLGVTGTGYVHGPGHVEAFSADRGGIDSRLDFDQFGPGQPVLTIDADLSVGEISVRSER